MAHVFKLLILFVLVQGVTPFSSVDSAFLPRHGAPCVGSKKSSSTWRQDKRQASIVVCLAHSHQLRRKLKKLLDNKQHGLGMYQEAKSLMNGEETVDEATKYIFTQICGLCVKKGVMGWRELEEMAEENDQLKLKVSSFVKLCLLLRHDESSSFLKALSVLEKGAGILQSQSRDVGERFASVIREYEKQLVRMTDRDRLLNILNLIRHAFLLLVAEMSHNPPDTRCEEEVCIITYKDTSPLSSSLAIINKIINSRTSQHQLSCDDLVVFEWSNVVQTFVVLCCLLASSANAGDQQVREFLARCRQKVEVEGSQGKESPEDRREFSSCQRAWRMGWTNLQLLLQQDEEVEIEAILITDASPLGWGGLLISEGSTAEAEEEEEGGSGAGVHSREDGGKKRVLVRRAWGRFEEEEQEQERGGRKRGEQVDQATRELMAVNHCLSCFEQQLKSKLILHLSDSQPSLDAIDRGCKGNALLDEEAVRFRRMRDEKQVQLLSIWVPAELMVATGGDSLSRTFVSH